MVGAVRPIGSQKEGGGGLFRCPILSFRLFCVFRTISFPQRTLAPLASTFPLDAVTISSVADSYPPHMHMVVCRFPKVKNLNIGQRSLVLVFRITTTSHMPKMCLINNVLVCQKVDCCRWYILLRWHTNRWCGYLQRHIRVLNIK